MTEFLTLYNIIIGCLVVILIIFTYILSNLLIKVEKYEDVSLEQTDYIVKISEIITKSQRNLKSLDERGVFQSDDEVGQFFTAMQDVQKQLDHFRVPLTYGKSKE
jgi:hypothetical protein|tara:strand:- start:40 stop:354 length:315 start_codon:yes stop_codon:yes gene_type:complete